MDQVTNAVPAELLHHPKTGSLNFLLDSVRNIAHMISRDGLCDTRRERSLGRGEKPLHLFAHFTDRHA